MYRHFSMLFVTLLVSVFLRPVLADGVSTTPQLRYSITPDTVRVVLDLPGEATYTDQSTPKALSFTLSTPLMKELAPLTLDDPIVTGVTVTPDAQGCAVLKIDLAQARKTHIFTLPPAEEKPFRLVIDILKRYNRSEEQTLAPGVRYTYLESQTDTRYLAAHLLEIDTRVPGVHLAVTAAQGDRERVCAMTARTGAVCGINGGYFLGTLNTRPVGLLKVDQQVLSLPIWGRSAVAFPAEGAPVLLNPQGVWHVTLPDGTTRDFSDVLDAQTQTPPPASLVINGRTFIQYPANPTGLTVVVRNGKIFARTTLAGELAPGDFAVQLSADEAKALDAQLVVDAAMTVTPVLTPDLAAYPSAVGAGPRLLRTGQIAISGQEERIPPDILNGRTARTGIGITADQQVVVAVVEPVGAYGGGATLDELAELLKDHGAVDALNLDGGGSSTLAIGANTVNYPPGAWVRPVASGVMVFSTKSLTIPDVGVAHNAVP